MRKMEIIGIGRIGIKVKSADFRVFTREKQVKIIGDSGILETAQNILSEFLKNELTDGIEEYFEIRLLGIRLSSLKYASDTKKRPSSSSTLMENWLKEAEIPVAKCPMCAKRFKNENDLAEVNGHVDECLSKLTMKEMIKENKL